MFSANNEWLKILISAMVGMVAGLLADPIRGLLQLRINTFRMESAIRMDFMALLIAIKALEHDSVPAAKFWEAVGVPAFEYYWERNRELFYNSFDLFTLHLQCMLVRALKESVIRKDTSEEEAIKKLSEVVSQVHASQKPLNWKRWIIFKFVR